MGRHFSIFYHNVASYPCPDCGKTMARAHIHGWFYHCDSCRKEFPLYQLEHIAKDKESATVDLPPAPAPIEPPLPPPPPAPEETIEEPKRKAAEKKVVEEKKPEPVVSKPSFMGRIVKKVKKGFRS